MDENTTGANMPDPRQTPNQAPTVSDQDAIATATDGAEAAQPQMDAAQRRADDASGQPQAQPYAAAAPSQPVEATAQQQGSYSAAYGAPGVQPAPAPVPGQMPYQAPYQQPMQGSGKATGALVCGILAILFCSFPILGIILGVVAIVLGTSYLKAGGTAGTAKGGRICGIVGIALSVIMMICVIVLGVLFLNAYDDGAFNGFVEEEIAVPPVSGNNGSALSGAEEEAAVAAGNEAMDMLVNKNPETVASIAALVDEGMAEEVGFTLADIGVDTKDYVVAMLGGFSYGNAEVYADVEGAAGTYEADMRVKDVLDVTDDFYEHIDRSVIESGGGAAAGYGELLMREVADADMDDTYISVGVSKENGKWIVDQDDWNAEMDLAFGLA